MRRSTAVPLGRSYLALAALATTAGLTSACGFGPERQVYCADQDGVVVNDSVCDSRTGGYYLWTGNYGRGIRPGTRLAGGGTRISPDDSAARSRAGIPSTGKVSNGSVVSGGFGSGHSSGHSGKSGG